MGGTCIYIYIERSSMFQSFLPQNWSRLHRIIVWGGEASQQTVDTSLRLTRRPVRTGRLTHFDLRTSTAVRMHSSLVRFESPVLIRTGERPGWSTPTSRAMFDILFAPKGRCLTHGTGTTQSRACATHASFSWGVILGFRMVCVCDRHIPDAPCMPTCGWFWGSML